MQKAVISVLIIFYLAQSEQLLAQKRNRIKKKPSASSQKGTEKANPKSQANDAFIWLDGFLGYAPLLDFSSYPDLAKEYYQPQNPSFKVSGELQKQHSILAGLAFQYGWNIQFGDVKFVSAGLAFNWLNRRLQNNIRFVNDSLKYRNQITISEKFDAQYLGTEFQLRFGSKLYGILGFRHDFLVQGVKERKLRLEGDSIQGGGAIESTEKWQLKSSELINQGTIGWHAGVGYAPMPFWGLRLGFMYGGSFFRSGPEWNSSFLYAAICFGWVK
jgi:hypothetical protein